ncbi:MAG: glycosyltransferase [Phycisphaerae bacterium]|nr:glycosyltransferase [Phycisphaerae bacterium]
MTGSNGQNPAIPWPRAEVPRRVAILGWARLSAQAIEGSGYNLSASELARGLVLCGHAVSYLASGMRYSLSRLPRVTYRETWGGVECFDLLNSPNLSPASANFENMASEVASPHQARLVVDWLRERRVEVVHIHSLEGYALDLIGAVRDAGMPVVVTPHNYWYVCPQVDLLHEELRVCLDYRGGERCVGCLRPKKGLVLKRSVGQTLERVMGLERANGVRRLLYGLKPAFKRLFGRDSADRSVRGRSDRPLNPDRLTDPELALGFDGDLPDGGEIKHDLVPPPGTGPRELTVSPLDENERFLQSPVHLKVLNGYGRRRAAGAAALNRASLVTSPSEFLRRAHVAMGVDTGRTRTVLLGQPHFDQINRRARRSPYYNSVPWEAATAARPVRFAFLGTTRANKGLEVLTQAIPLLDPAVRRRCHFVIRALGWDWPFRVRLSRFPEVSFAGGYDLMQLISMHGEYDVGVLPHIWFENSPLVMLEHLHAGKFVISSRLGGPADWIDPPRNGLFFRAGDPSDLAACLASVAEGRVRLPTAREVHESSRLQSYPGHVRSIQVIYEEVIREVGTGGAVLDQ